jgi:hypothetical protein
MTATELTDGCFAARTRFNTWRSIGHRLLDWQTNCRSPYRAAIYCAANVVSRREIRSKQARHLGAAEPGTVAEIRP